ncbi:MAG: Tyrosine--tRNA ligase [Candidatus Heimdallarchaeota archaeon LC_3]|nr:MAG: Tyrosine--tRNA ligase [Candidatus Heimdallarchaeota archaeon LC_3]
MTFEEKLSLITRNTEEVINTEELEKIFNEHTHPKAYVGLEISGFLHLGTGIILPKKLNDLHDAGFEVIVFLADWHSMINNKLGGDLNAIQEIGREYFQDALKIAGLGGKKRIKFLWSSELTNDSNYWKEVIQVAKSTTMQRMIRCLPIMGREDNVQNEMEAAFLFYPPMQCADIFQIEGGLQMATGGMDQRRIHMLAREVAPKLNREKPVILHTPLLMGLKGAKMDAHASGDDLGGLAEAKMSKSDPSSAIFTHETPKSIKTKLKKAHCPEKVVENNPIIEIAKLIHFPFVGNLKIERKPKFGGDIVFKSFEKMSQAFTKGELHPLDLKFAMVDTLSELMEPSRTYFETHIEKIELMSKYKISK